MRRRDHIGAALALWIVYEPSALRNALIRTHVLFALRPPLWWF